MILKVHSSRIVTVDYGLDAFGLVGGGKFHHLDEAYLSLTRAELSSPAASSQVGRMTAECSLLSGDRPIVSILGLGSVLGGLHLTAASLREFVAYVSSHRDYLSRWKGGVVSPRIGWHANATAFVPWFVRQDGRDALTMRDVRRPVGTDMVVLATELD